MAKCVALAVAVTVDSHACWTCASKPEPWVIRVAQEGVAIPDSNVCLVFAVRLYLEGGQVNHAKLMEPATADSGVLPAPVCRLGVWLSLVWQMVRVIPGSLALQAPAPLPDTWVNRVVQVEFVTATSPAMPASA